MKLFVRNSLTFLTTATLLLAAVGPSGCAAAQDDLDGLEDGPEEEVATTEQPLSACSIAGAAAGAAGGFAVTAWWTTGACAGGTLVTTAGTTTPICLVPAVGAAAATLASVAAGGVAYLACDHMSGWVQARRQSAGGTYTIRCNISGPWGRPECNGAVTASGSTCAEAKEAANRKVPAGCYKRHCHETGGGPRCR